MPKLEQNHKHHRRRSRWRSLDFLHRKKPVETFLTGCLNSPVCSSLKPLRTTKFMMPLITFILTSVILISTVQAQNTPLNFLTPMTLNLLLPGHNMENFRVSEITPIDSVVYTLKAIDKLNETRKFSYHMTGDTFQVDEQTGQVRLRKQLDRERQAQIVVVISVFDLSDFKNENPVESKRKTIIVEDADDSWPLFAPHKHSLGTNGQNQVYQVEISEQALSNSIVLSDIQVTDADEGPNAEVSFECRARQSTNSACEVFSIEPRKLSSGRYSITVKTRQPLDYERVQAYKMSLVARGKRPSPLTGMPLESEALINVQVLNVQDEGPMFVNAPYSLSMFEGSEPNKKLLDLIVQDGDAASQRELSMMVVPSPVSHYFDVVRDPELSKVWYLVTSKITIDREDALISQNNNMFTISLLAGELNNEGNAVASEVEFNNALNDPNYSRGTLRRENVTIVVLDLPDSTPIFTQASTGRPFKDNVLVVNVSESVASGSSLPNLDLAVLDFDQGVNSRFNLSLHDSDDERQVGPRASSVFALESEVIYGKAEIVLNVLNSSLLDFEQPALRVYRFSLVASKSDSLVRMLEVQVNVLDANDNTPEFDKDQYVLEVPEGALPGTLVGVVRAKDRDSGAFGRIDYALRGAGASKFKLIPSEAKIIVGDCGVSQCIDFESQASFSLTYEARDGGGRTKNVSVLINVIDLNDHAPKFTEMIYKRELISDNLSSRQNYISPQLIVRAKDGDGPTQGRNSVTYRIKSSNLTNLEVEPSSGLVYFSQPLDLDSAIAAAAVAGAAEGSEPMRVAANNERRIVFEAEVLAEDNGTPPLNSTAKILLVVKGNREGAPQFRQELYQVQVRENQPPNKPFYQVQAVDPDEKDSQLRYSLGFDLNDLVDINALTGELSFKTRVDYDEFKDEPYNITVQATDNSKPYPLRASAVVSILVQDVNDKRPRFREKEYRSTLTQGRTRKGEQVMQVNALDPDTNAKLNYSLVSDQMLLDDRNGLQLTLDDLANSTTGYLAQVSAKERAQLVADFRRMFQINKQTGAIELRLEPDYSFAASITLLARVVDLNQEIPNANNGLQEDFVNCTFFLQTHVDRMPVFAPPWSIEKRDYNLSILEELAPGTAIFSLLAKDPQTNARVEIFEKIFESDPKDYFRVDRSGVVYVNRRIDYEELPSATTGKRLSVAVKAIAEPTAGQIYASTANLNIQVVDLNDNAPQFKANTNYSVAVSESISYPSEILTVNAEDRDSNEFGQVYYSLSGYSAEHFTIEPRRGVISVKRGVKLDRDLEPQHWLFVTASDCNETSAETSSSGKTQFSDGTTGAQGCRRTSILVSVVLLDENDNDPLFVNVNKRGELEALASETVSAGSIIAQAQAVDADEGENGRLGFEIVSADEAISKLIKIDQDGFISVVDSLAGLGRSQPYRATVRAFDHGKGQARQAFANLLLNISDVVANDGVPRIVHPKADELVELSESVGPSTFVYKVQAVDPDEETSGKLIYSFNQASDVFEIDPFTGIIKTQHRLRFGGLDREVVPNYTLIVVAQDLGSPPKQTHQVLNIRITDVNDNEPFFERQLDDPPLVLAVEEESPKDTLIGTIQATDKDIDQNALIGYQIIDGNQQNLFRLDFGQANESQLVGNNPCRIYSNARLDREARESYTLTIKASSASKMRNPFVYQIRDSSNDRNSFNQYNASDLTKILVTIKLIDINDNRPMFVQQNAKSVVDSSAEVYSQLLVFKAVDADSSNNEMHYSILDVLYFSDSKFRPLEDLSTSTYKSSNQQSSIQPVSMRHAFDIDSRTGILRNSVPLRSYIDGYFEVYVKADSGSQLQKDNVAPIDEYSSGSLKRPGELNEQSLSSKCYDSASNQILLDGLKQQVTSTTASSGGPYNNLENCFVAITKAVVFVTHQRETFRFVFNKTKLNDRFDEFKSKIQSALEEIMFEPSPQASSDASARESSLPLPKGDKIYLNTFNTEFYEREDGSLDFSTLTSCSQMVKFDDRSTQMQDLPLTASTSYTAPSGSSSNTIVPNQVINYEEVLQLLKTLNQTQLRQQKSSLFNQYGLVNIERCSLDRTMHKMSLSERCAIYFAISIALISLLLALIVSKMRKSYEKNLKLLQRSKYQYMSPYSTLGPNQMGAQQLRQAPHHMSLGTLQGSSNFIAPAYGTHLEFDRPLYDTWQL